MVSSPRSLRPRGRDANVVREEIGSMGVHELDQVLANAAAAVDDSRRCATCSVQQRSRGSRGSGKTFDGGTAYSHLSASDHRRKDAQCIRYASGGSVATRTCVGWQRGLPGRRRAWQVQVALNRCYYMLNRRRRLTSATPSVLGDAIWLRCGECGAGSRCMQDLMKRGERRTALC